MIFEEWWGRTFEGRGTISGDQMPDVTPEVLRKLSTIDVLKLAVSEEGRSYRGLLAQMEQRRREEWTARFAAVVSVAALVISAAALIVGD